MKVKRHELVKSLCCCMTFNWCDQRRDGAKCWKLLKKVNARMISLPPPPILKVIHRSHHSRCGEEILGSHTGAPTATQGLPLGTKPEISTLWRSWGSTGAPQQGKYISGGSHTNMHEIYQGKRFQFLAALKSFTIQTWHLSSMSTVKLPILKKYHALAYGIFCIY